MKKKSLPKSREELRNRNRSCSNTYILPNSNIYQQFPSIMPESSVVLPNNTLLQARPITVVHNTAFTHLGVHAPINPCLHTQKINTYGQVYTNQMCNIQQCIHFPYNCVSNRLYNFWCPFCKHSQAKIISVPNKLNSINNEFYLRP